MWGRSRTRPSPRCFLPAKYSLRSVVRCLIALRPLPPQCQPSEQHDDRHPGEPRLPRQQARQPHAGGHEKDRQLPSHERVRPRVTSSNKHLLGTKVVGCTGADRHRPHRDVRFMLHFRCASATVLARPRENRQERHGRTHGTRVALRTGARPDSGVPLSHRTPGVLTTFRPRTPQVSSCYR